MKRNLKKLTVVMLSGMLMVQPDVPFMGEDFGITAEAHSGRTDSSGGHKDNKNKSGLGSYHYHCGGNPAHLHEGGVCPYSSEYSSSNASFSSSSSQSGSSSGISISGKSIELSSGEDISISKDLVKILQDVLNQKGYECGSADGIIGEKTKKALEDFLEKEYELGTDHMIISMFAESLGIK